MVKLDPIEVKLEKVFTEGYSYKVVETKIAHRRDLPIEYMTNFPHCEQDGDGGIKIVLWYPNRVLYLIVGRIYSKKGIKERISAIRRCTKELSRIQEEIEKKQKAWKGIETIII